MRHAQPYGQRPACQGADPGLFFGPDGETAPEREHRERAAKAVCVLCPVREACLRHALTEPELAGVWGGTGEAERVSLRKSLAHKRLEAGRFAALLEAGEKTCAGCEDPKPLDAFPWRNGRPRSRCHECVAAYMREWKAAA